jgi:hypothetical protein
MASFALTVWATLEEISAALATIGYPQRDSP